MKRWITFIFALVAVGLLAISLLPFQDVRHWLDAHAGDGSADPYTPQLHRTIRMAAAATLVVWIGTGALIGFALKRYSVRIGSWIDGLRRELRWFRSSGRRLLAAHGLTLLALALLAAVVRLPYLSQPLRFDEAYTYLTYASQPLPVTVATYHDPNNHILHSVLVHVSTALFGPAEWSIRLPALVAGILLAPVVYLIGIFQCRGTGLLAAGLTIIGSPLVEYSVLARGYAIVVLLTTLSLGVIVALISDPRISKAPSLILSVLAVFGFWTVPTYLYSFAVVATFLFLIRLRTGWGWRDAMAELMCLGILTAVGTLLVYLPVFVITGYRAIVANPYVVSQSIPQFAVSIVPWLGDVFRFMTRDVPIAAQATMIIGIGWALLSNNSPPAKWLRLLVAASLTVLGLVTVQRVTPYPRVILFLLPVAILLGATGWMQILGVAKGKTRTVVGAVLVSLIVWTAAHAVSSDSIVNSTEGGRCKEAPLVAEALSRRLSDDDYVLVSSPCSSPLMYYAQLAGVPLERFAPPPENEKAYGRLFAVISERGQRLPALLRSLGVDQVPADDRWATLQRFGEVTILEYERSHHAPRERDGYRMPGPRSGRRGVAGDKRSAIRISEAPSPETYSIKFIDHKVVADLIFGSGASITRRGCEFIRSLSLIVAFCSAKVALRDATFAERKATIIDSQPRSVMATFPLRSGAFRP